MSPVKKTKTIPRTGAAPTLCHIHDNVSNEEIDEIRANVCVNDFLFEQHTDGKHYCLFHLPTIDKDKEKFTEVFEGRLDAADNVPAGDTQSILYDFRYIWFPCEVDLSERTFSGSADFSSATFSGSASFRSATFSGGAYFRSATFSENSYADFSSATFSGGASFRSATFSGSADFSSATFSENSYADFSSATFSGSASFRSATFSGGADFSSATFSGSADFSSATFSENSYADFSSATFSGSASFRSATFSGGADFSSATFSGSASFRSATFSGGADFSSATFSGSAYFSSAMFAETSQISFEKTSFNRKVDFNRTIFLGYVIFAGADNQIAFEIANEENNGAILDLQNARLEKPDRISFHRVRLCPGWFVNVDSRKMVFTDIDWDRLDADRKNTNISTELEELARRGIDNPRRLLEIACRQLAVNAEDNNRYEEAAKFRYMAMETKRLEVVKKEKHVSRFITWLYKWSSGYGEKWERAALVLLLLLVFFGFVFFLPISRFDHGEKPLPNHDTFASRTCGHLNISTDPSAGLNLCDGMVHSLYVAALQRPEPKAADALTRFLVILLTIFGPLQAALLALAIRRKFMR